MPQKTLHVDKIIWVCRNCGLVKETSGYLMAPDSLPHTPNCMIEHDWFPIEVKKKGSK